MKPNKKTQSQKPLSDREKSIGFLYVLFLFAIVVGVSSYFLFKHEDTSNIMSNKMIVIKKMERLKEFQTLQSNYMPIVDTLFSKINLYEPGINASYEENDIKFMINDLIGQWNSNNWDKRNKAFWHLGVMYEMWFADKQELWSKQDNIVKFKRNLDECELGLQKKENELKEKTGK